MERTKYIEKNIRRKLLEHYGYVSDPKRTPRHNTYIRFHDMPKWEYFGRTQNKAFHDLTLGRTSRNHVKQLLGLGLKFIPTPYFTNYNLQDTKQRLLRRMKLHAYYMGADTMRPKTKKELKIHINSKWTPLDWMIPRETVYRGNKFLNEVDKLFIKNRGKNNLLPIQRRALAYLQKQDNIIIVQCDKNMGPATMERERYVRMVLDHLSQDHYYKKLDFSEHERHVRNIARKLEDWTQKYAMELSESQRKYLMEQSDLERTTLPYFYATIKVHKDELGLRPITACCGSVLYRLGIIIDMYLHKVAETFESYIKNSKAFKDRLLSERHTEGTQIFTADARAMYTNIDTRAAINEINYFLFANQRKFPGLPVGAVINGLKIIMENNIFTFGDTLWTQVNGAAMGQPPSPSYARIFFGIYERKIIPELKRLGILTHYSRYLDDVFGCWKQRNNQRLDTAQWETFKDTMNKYYGLTWDFKERTDQINFLDIKVSINKRGKISTNLHEKELNPYLYITPGSSHPPGVLKGLILGNCYRIFTLVSNKRNRKEHFNRFFIRLLHRGYTRHQLLPIFRKAAEKEKERRDYNLQMERAMNPRPKPLYFHMQYHPQDPKSSTIQRQWRDIVTEPPGGKKYSEVENNKGAELGETRLIVAYSRPPNLGNILSSKIIQKTKGPPVSSYTD